MTEQNNEIQVSIDDIHAFLEKTLMEAYLKGKGYSAEELKKLPEDQVKKLNIEASTYASNKLAEVELRAHFLHELHDAYADE